MALPDPLMPADCDLSTIPALPVDIVRLLDSGFNAVANDSEWRCGLTLWLKSFHQVPAASLPDDDAQLTQLAGLGRDRKTWAACRAVALRGWVKCSDGRLYHRLLAGKALIAWVAMLSQRKLSAAGVAGRLHGTFDAAPHDAAIGRAMWFLKAVAPDHRPPASVKDIALVPPDSGPVVEPEVDRAVDHAVDRTVNNTVDHRVDHTVDQSNLIKPNLTKEEGEKVFPSIPDAGDKPAKLTPVLIEAAFDRWWEQVGKKVDKGDARKVFARILKNDVATEDELTTGMQRYVRETAGREPQYVKGPARWLNAEGWRDAPGMSLPPLQIQAPQPPSNSAAMGAVRGMIENLQRDELHGQAIEPDDIAFESGDAQPFKQLRNN